MEKLTDANWQLAYIKALYETFKRKDLAALVDFYHPDVEYVNEPKGIHLKNRDQLSAQWRDHAGRVGISLTPQTIRSIPSGVFVKVREVLTRLDGEVFFDGQVGHAYEFLDGAIRRCDILDHDAYE